MPWHMLHLFVSLPRISTSLQEDIYTKQCSLATTYSIKFQGGFQESCASVYLQARYFLVFAAALLATGKVPDSRGFGHM